MDHRNYPRLMYHQTEGHKRVFNELEEKTLPKGWQRTPFPPAPEPEAESEPLQEQIHRLMRAGIELAGRVVTLEKRVAALEAGKKK